MQLMMKLLLLLKKKKVLNLQVINYV